MSRGLRISNQRALRVGEEIRHALAYLIIRTDLHNLSLVEKQLTITEVRVSIDLHRAVVFIVPLGGGNPTQALVGLRRARSFFRYMLSQIVKLPFTPSLYFKADTCFDTASKIERILHQPNVRRDLL